MAKCIAHSGDALFAALLVLETRRRKGRRPLLRMRSSSNIRRRLEVSCPAALVRRPFDDLLEQEVHEQEQRLRLEHQDDRLALGSSLKC